MNYLYLKSLMRGVNSVLDIGAHFGEFTKEMMNQIPDASFHMIEANPECEQRLQLIGVPYDIELLSDGKSEVTYYMNKNDLTSTGNSYYREATHHFSNDNLIQMNRATKTLDSIFENKTFDLIKIDTQGSEIDILKGGLNLAKNAKYILLECSIIEYNIGAPLLGEVKSFMEEIGYDFFKVIEDHVIDGELVQQDILFKNRRN